MIVSMAILGIEHFKVVVSRSINNCVDPFWLLEVLIVRILYIFEPYNNIEGRSGWLERSRV